MPPPPTCSCPQSEVIPPIHCGTYCSDWCCVTHVQIDAFAAATGDHQWIHRYDAQDTGSPFRGPIAHGLLLMSFAISLARDSSALRDSTWILYGFDKVRFRAPVPSDTRIRCWTTLRGEKQLGVKTLVDVRFVMEIENQKIPAFVADCSLLKLGSDLVPPSTVPVVIPPG